MGEEEKKPEEKKTEEKKPEKAKKTEEVKTGEEKPAAEKPAEEKKEEKKGDDSKADAGKEGKDTAPPPPPPPQEIVLRVFMHCEGCAKKVRRCLKNFEGVEDVMTDCKTSKVIVKGEKADPLKVLDRVQRKSHRQVELISPIPKPPSEEEKKNEEKEKPKPEEKKEEPQVITVILKVHMHCEACAEEIKKRIMRMKGVESAEPDLKSSQVTVKGVFDPPKLVEYVYKRTGKHAMVVKIEPEKKEEDDKGKDVNKEDKKDGGGDGGGNKKEKKEGGGEEKNEKKEGGGGGGGGGEEGKEKTGEETGEGEEVKIVELKRNEYYYYPQKYAMEYYSYPPQMFSDENPNACSVM